MDPERVKEVEEQLARDGVPAICDTSKASEVLGLHRNTLANYTRDARIKHYYVGNGYRYSRRELATFIASCAAQRTAQSTAKRKKRS